MTHFHFLARSSLVFANRFVIYDLSQRFPSFFVGKPPGFYLVVGGTYTYSLDTILKVQDKGLFLISLGTSSSVRDGEEEDRGQEDRG